MVRCDEKSPKLLDSYDLQLSYYLGRLGRFFADIREEQSSRCEGLQERRTTSRGEDNLRNLLTFH